MMDRHHKFDMHYSTGVVITIKAKTCEVEKRNGVITSVDFKDCRNWASFTIVNLVAVVQR